MLKLNQLSLLRKVVGIGIKDENYYNKQLKKPSNKSGLRTMECRIS